MLEYIFRNRYSLKTHFQKGIENTYIGWRRSLCTETANIMYRDIFRNV